MPKVVSTPPPPSPPPTLACRMLSFTFNFCMCHAASLGVRVQWSGFRVSGSRFRLCGSEPRVELFSRLVHELFQVASYRSRALLGYSENGIQRCEVGRPNHHDVKVGSDQ